MTTILVLGPEEKRQIEALIARAAANPVRWATIKDAALKIAERDDKRDLPLADRPPGIERPPSDHLMLGTVRVAYSVEEQPSGMCRHLSASVGRPGYLPDVHVMTALCEAFGFANFPPLTGRVWTEEFDPGHRAVNVVELIQEVGHA